MKTSVHPAKAQIPACDPALATLRGQCLIALMSNREISVWVADDARKAGHGGPLKVWTDLAKEYADQLISK